MVDETDREYSNPKEDPSYPEYEYEQGDQGWDDLQMLDGMIRDRIEEVKSIPKSECEDKIKSLAEEIHKECVQFDVDYIKERIEEIF